MDAVTQILVDRSREADTVSRMVVLSLIVHGALISAVTFIPSKWSSTPDPANVMTISLGGAPGPFQGRNPISNKPIQEAVPDTAKPKDTTPPPPKPEMVEPVKTAPLPPKTTAKAEPPKEQQLRGRTPTQGTQVREGTAKVETGSQSQTKFGGLATGGGGGGDQAYTDYADFCCPEYLDQMVSFVRRNWQERQGQDGTVRIKFTIQRDGMLTNIEVERPAAPMLNIAAQRAIVNTRQLPPLPAAFNGDRLTVHLNMTFTR